MSDTSLLVRCLDLTSLRGDETEDDVLALCERASAHGVAAVVVHPQHVATAKRALDGSYVRVATVGGGFPDATTSLDDRLFDDDLVIRFDNGAAERSGGVSPATPSRWRRRERDRSRDRGPVPRP